MAKIFPFITSPDVSCLWTLVVLLACTCSFVLSAQGFAGQMSSLVAVI